MIKERAMPKNKSVFHIGSVLLYWKSFRYLGFTLGDHFAFGTGIGLLSDTAGRALGVVQDKVALIGYRL